MNNEKNPTEMNPTLAIGEAELDAVVATLPVRTGVRAGAGRPRPIIPCI